MRIVLSNSSVRWGGVHRVTDIVARGLMSRGHDVVVFGRPGSMLEERMRGVAPFEGILGGLDFDPLTLWRSRRALKRHRSQVLVGLMKKDVRQSMIAARSLGIPTIIRHSYEQPLPRGPGVRMLYGGPVMHVTNAEATRKAVLDSAAWLDPSKIEVIYNGIDAAPYMAALPIAMGIPDDAVRFGFIGNISGRKGIDEMARAWHEVSKDVPNAHLVIVGKGRGEDRFREMLSGADRVHWLGYRTDIPSVLKSLDVLVLPSHLEGVPNVVLEAMAARVAVIATSVSGTPELVRDGIEARLVPARDSSRLADAMKELARDSGLRLNFAARGHARALESFTIDQMIDRYEQLFERITSGR
jgi:glycosyltransferase involved in cell wall biosynthesis